MKRTRKRGEQLGYVEGPKDGSFFLRYWTEPDAAGERHRRAVEVGVKGQFRNRQEANLSVEAAELRRKLNAGVMGRTVGHVIADFERERMPTRMNTRNTVLGSLAHIRHRWEDTPVAELADPRRAKLIEGWINDLRTREVRKGHPAHRASYSLRKNVRQQLATLFKFAMRRGFIPSMENPVKFTKLDRVEVERRRQTLTADLIRAFFADPDIPEYVKVMAQAARLSGLRISEVRGLQDSDFDLDVTPMKITVHRRLWRSEIRDPKSQCSGQWVPMCDELFQILSAWRKSDFYFPTEEEWLFASPHTGMPYTSEGTQSDYLRPWGRKHGVEKMGWHTFRHTLKQTLEDNDTPAEVVQRLMRHSSYRITEKYGSGVKAERLEAGIATLVAAQSRKTVATMKRKWA